MKSNVIQFYICAVVILVLGCTLTYIVQHKKPSLMRAFPLYKKNIIYLILFLVILKI